MLQIEIRGMDIFDPTTGEVRSSGGKELMNDVAAWFIDNDYDEESFFVRQAYFVGDDPYEGLKRALKAEIDETAWAELNSTISRPSRGPAWPDLRQSHQPLRRRGAEGVSSLMRPQMALTRSFKDHIKAKIQSDPEFRQALFQEAVQTLIEGDVGTARFGIARLHQCDHRVSSIGQSHRNTAQEPHADVRPERQSDRGQSVRRSSGYCRSRPRHLEVRASAA